MRSQSPPQHRGKRQRSDHQCAVQYAVLICVAQRESKNITFPFSFSSWHQLTCNCSHLAHTLYREKSLLVTKGHKKKEVPYQLALHNFSLTFDLYLFHASRLLGKDAEVLSVQPLSPSANRCVGKAQISSWSFAGSINNLFVLIHQVCGCRNQCLCSMWGLSISWMSAVSWCISLFFEQRSGPLQGYYARLVPPIHHA